MPWGSQRVRQYLRGREEWGGGGWGVGRGGGGGGGGGGGVEWSGDSSGADDGGDDRDGHQRRRRCTVSWTQKYCLHGATDDRLRFTRCHSEQSIEKDKSIVRFPVLIPPG